MSSKAEPCLSHLGTSPASAYNFESPSRCLLCSALNFVHYRVLFTGTHFSLEKRPKLRLFYSQCIEVLDLPDDRPHKLQFGPLQSPGDANGMLSIFIVFI